MTRFLTTGRVNKWKIDQGYGFIICDDGSSDVFAHIKDFRRGGIEEDEIRTGQRYEFEAKSDDVRCGPCRVAVNIRRLDVSTR